MYYVYKMIHVPTGRVYVGQRKLQKGKTPETDGYHGSGKIWKRIYKAHPEECVKIVLEVVNTKKEIDALERKFIAHYRSLMGEKCVNIADGGEGGYGGCGKRSEETKRNIAESKIGEKNPLFGKHHSEATRKKMSDAKVGKTPWNKGKHFSDETRKKMSESRKKTHRTEEYRKKMSEIVSGRKNRTKVK